MTGRFFSLGLAALVTATAATDVCAQDQQPSQRPYRGLFGGGVGNVSQSLVLNGSISGVHFNDLTDRQAAPAPLPTTNRRNRNYTVGNVNLAYNVSGSRLSANLSAIAQGRYVPSGSSRVTGTYAFGGGSSFRVTDSTLLTANVRAGVYLRNRAALLGNGLGAVTDPTSPIDPSYFGDPGTFKNLHGNVRLSQSLGARLSANVGYGYYGNDIWGGRYSVQHVDAGVGYNLARGLSARVSYGFTESTGGAFGGTSTNRGRTINGGVLFNRALSLSRRSTLSFSTGVQGFNDQNGRTRYTATGHVGFNYELGRSWNLSSNYHRSASLDQTLGQPVVRDAISVGVNGLIGRRFQVGSFARYHTGDVGVGPGTSGYTAAGAAVSLRTALNRYLALGVGYDYYEHEFGVNTILPTGVQPITRGQTIRVSLNAWLPLMQGSRRP